MTVPLSVTVGVSCPLMCHFMVPWIMSLCVTAVVIHPQGVGMSTFGHLRNWRNGRNCMRHTEGLQLENKRSVLSLQRIY